MTKTELKTYYGVLKGLAKTAPLPIWRNVGIKDNRIEATDLDHIFTLCNKIEGDGVYNPQALDLNLIDENSSIEAYKEGDWTEDWVEFYEVAHHTVELTPEVVAKIIYAMNFISKDTMRPALCRVWIKDGRVEASDGYKLYMSDKILADTFEANFSAKTLSAFKKVAKHGTWILSVTEHSASLSNGIITLRNKLVEGFPDLPSLCSKAATASVKVELPIKQILTLAQKDDILNVHKDGSLVLAGRPLPLNATISAEDKTYGGERKVLMGHVNNDNTVVLFRLAPQQLKSFGATEMITIRVATKEPITWLNVD